MFIFFTEVFIMNLSYKYLHFYIISILVCIPVWVLHLSLMLIYFKLMCGSFLKPFPCLLNAFCVFCFTERSTNSSHARSCLQIPGKMILSEKLDKFKPVMDFDFFRSDHTLCIRSVGNKQLQRLQQLFRKSWITDLASETEMSRDWTNMEHRYEVEGSTWAGVCRSWKKGEKTATTMKS